MSKHSVKKKLFQTFLLIAFISPAGIALSAQTDSSKILPPESISMMPITTPTMTSLSQASINALLADPSKECLPNETRDYCWKRYRATVGSIAPSNTLECPGKYFSITRFGKEALDNSGKPLTYFDPSLYQKVTDAQYPILQSLGYTCYGSQTQGTYEYGGSGTTCYYQSEGATTSSFSGKTISMPDGFLGLNDPTLTKGYGPQDWTTWGANRCDRYTPAGCPGAWCSRTIKYGYIFRWIECSRPAGYYNPIDPTIARVNNLVIPLASTQYTPTIVICSRAIAGFQPNP